MLRYDASRNVWRECLIANANIHAYSSGKMEQV